MGCFGSSWFNHRVYCSKTCVQSFFIVCEFCTAAVSVLNCAASVVLCELYYTAVLYSLYCCASCTVLHQLHCASCTAVRIAVLYQQYYAGCAALPYVRVPHYCTAVLPCCKCMCCIVLSPRCAVYCCVSLYGTAVLFCTIARTGALFTRPPAFSSCTAGALLIFTDFTVFVSGHGVTYINFVQ